MLSPSERTQRARVAAYHLHAQNKTNTAPARAAFLGRFEKQVDPDGVLDPATRARLAMYARKAYFLELARKSAAARRRGDAS